MKSHLLFLTSIKKQKNGGTGSGPQAIVMVKANEETHEEKKYKLFSSTHVRQNHVHNFNCISLFYV